MQKSIKGFLAFPLILSFLFASVICCCQLSHAEAGISHQEATKNTPIFSRNSHCDPGDSQDHHSADHQSEGHTCECPKLQGTLAKNFDIVKAADIVLYSFNHQISLDKIFLAFVPDSHNLLAGSSPPKLSSTSIPLYIKNPTLRI